MENGRAPGRAVAAVLGAVLVAALATVPLLCGLALERVGDAPEAPPARVEAPGGAVIDGADVFLSAGCDACHRLRAIGARGTGGPDLDVHVRTHPHTLDELARLIALGGRGMPAYRSRLSEREIRSVAAFVLEATRLRSS